MVEILSVWVKSIFSTFGYPGLGLVMFLENVFPPIPSEIVLPLAGSLTLDGTFNLWGITLVGALGSVAGAWVFYGIGYWYDEARLRVFIRKYGKWFMLQEVDLDRAIDWFHRYGDLTIFFGRWVPLVRSLISLPAGMAHMKKLPFTLYTTAGTAIWCLLLALGGRLLGQGWMKVSEWMNGYQNITFVLLVALAGLFFAYRLLQPEPAAARNGRGES